MNTTRKNATIQIVLPDAQKRTGQRQITKTFRWTTLGLATFAAFGLSAVRPAAAQVSQLSDFQVDVATQTGTSTTSDVGWFFDSRLFLTSPGDVVTAALDYPGPGSPSDYGLSSPTLLDFSSPYYASQAALLAAFPDGDYTASYSGGTQGAGSVAIDYTQSPFSDQPIFTAGTFTGAQGLNATDDFTFTWNGFTNPTSDAYAFFNVEDAVTGTSVYNGSFLPSDTLSQTISGGTLTADRSYFAEIDFSSRIDGSSWGIDTFQGFDRETSFMFTATPEPSQYASLGIGLLSLGVLALKARRRKADAA